jgi:L-rhamnose mutarotase
MFLKAGCEEEYERRHAAIWPELRALLSESGVYDYSIYWDTDTNILFACQKTRGEHSSQDMGSNPIVQKWWDYMADLMEVNADNSPITIPLPEVFHMD